MKFYRYPLALISYALLVIFAFAFAWNYLGHSKLETYWYYFPAGAAFYLTLSFILSKLNIHWEWDVAIQVVFVLVPVLWYVNIKEPYKHPTYIFVVNSGYAGKLDIIFNLDKNAPTNAHSTADTLYFNFDENGEILLNEDVAYIKEAMKKQLFFLHPDATKTKIPYAEKNALPADTTKEVLVADSVEAENGRMKVMHYRLDFPQHLK
ncbi:MAG TPA: hypothetical protein VFJ43_16295 [Bacteroidia bacterium]|nr:hypothetical protein [Bacteroidia bacterium]